MPTIKPVNWLHPVSSNADKVISSIEEMTLDKAKEIGKLNPLSFIQMLVPDLGRNVEGEARKEHSFLKINENLKLFLDRAILIQDKNPGFYVYRLIADHYTYTGIWACTSVDDFANQSIKAHETTSPPRVEHLAEYFEKTGIDANPILLTYRSSELINNIISSVVITDPDIEFNSKSDAYALWNISDISSINILSSAMSALDRVYIADGHHRAAAALEYSLENTIPGICFSTVYMADDQLKLYSFNRLVSGLGNFDYDCFLEAIRIDFDVSEYDKLNLDLHEIAIYTGGVWLKLRAKPHLYQDKVLLKALDVSILQEHIFQPLLSVENLEADNRISFISGKHPVRELEQKIDSGAYQMAFVLAPPSIDSLFEIANSDKVMPPKSTFFEPKFPAGLLIHCLYNQC